MRKFSIGDRVVVSGRSDLDDAEFFDIGATGEVIEVQGNEEYCMVRLDDGMVWGIDWLDLEFEVKVGTLIRAIEDIEGLDGPMVLKGAMGIVCEVDEWGPRRAVWYDIEPAAEGCAVWFICPAWFEVIE